MSITTITKTELARAKRIKDRGQKLFAVLAGELLAVSLDPVLRRRLSA